jgi:DNA-binding NtrC family response regulator
MGKAKVLLVDDELDYLNVMKARIESWGYEVLTSQEGKESLGIIKDKSPDIAILDYLMPGMDGVAVLKEIRRSNKDLPVIMLTAHSEVENIKAAQDLGVSTFIPKLSAYSDAQSSLRVALDLAQKKIEG